MANYRRNVNTEDKEAEATSVRPKRVAVGLRPKLDVRGKNPNYEYRIVNDIPGRISMYLDGGWETCTNGEVETSTFRVEDTPDLGSLAYFIVDGGTGMKAYVLKIKKEWYKEFEEQHEAEVARTEETLHPNFEDGGYGSIKIDRSGRR